MSAEAESGETVEILLREGVYKLDGTVSISYDGERVPLAIKAYRNENVRLSGGVDLRLSDMEPAAAAFTDRIIDKPGEQKILQYDLKEAGIGDYGEISRRGYRISENKTAQAELSLNGTVQRLAAWPNEDYAGFVSSDNLGTRRLPDSNNPGRASVKDGCSFTVDFDRPSKWSEQSSVWLSGVVADNFFNDYYPMERFDEATKTVYLREGAVKIYDSSYASKPFFRFENIPEELDAPGEYYIDRNSGMLYFYPPEDADESSRLTISMTDTDLIRLENSKNITLEGLTLDSGRKSAVSGSGTSGITIKNCDIYGFGGNGIRLDSTTKARIEGCRIHDVGMNGVMLSGGDYAKLGSSQNVIYNNDIYNFARLERCYYAGVYLGYQSVGMTVERNHIHNAPHAGLIYYGANHRIKGNEIDSVVTECHDMGAIYANISEFPWERGTTVEGNYFHDLGRQVFRGQKQMNISVVYNDNRGCGITVTGNLFRNIGTNRSNSVCGVMAEGTHNKVNNNVFLDCSGTYKAMGASYDPNLRYAETDTIGGRTVEYLRPLLAQRLEVYGRAFPELERFFDEHPRAVQTNEFCGNLAVNISSGISEIDLDKNAKGFRGTVELVKAQDNILGKSEYKDYFKDYDGGDYGLTAKALGALKNMPNINMNDFGLVKN